MKINQNEFNAFCVDCQNNRSTHGNITFGTFVCAECAVLHQQDYHFFQSYIKSLDEVWDPYQLLIVEQGGNKPFYEFMRDYGREREAISQKYRSDAAWYYRKVLHFRAKGIEFTERAPPKNAAEAAERAAKDTA